MVSIKKDNRKKIHFAFFILKSGLYFWEWAVCKLLPNMHPFVSKNESLKVSTWDWPWENVGCSWSSVKSVTLVRVFFTCMVKSKKVLRLSCSKNKILLLIYFIKEPQSSCVVLDKSCNFSGFQYSCFSYFILRY